MKTNIGEVNNLAFRKEKSDYNFGQWVLGFVLTFLLIAGWSLITLIF